MRVNGEGGAVMAGGAVVAVVDHVVERMWMSPWEMWAVASHSRLCRMYVVSDAAINFVQMFCRCWNHAMVCIIPVSVYHHL